MEPDTSFRDILERSFRLLVADPAPLAVDGREIHPDLPDRPIPLDELRALLLKETTGFAVRNAALAVLIGRAKQEPSAWVVGLAGVLLPGLRRLAGRLARDFPGEVADIDAEVLTGFLEALENVEPAGESLAGGCCGRPTGGRGGCGWSSSSSACRASPTRPPRTCPRSRGGIRTSCSPARSRPG